MMPNKDGYTTLRELKASESMKTIPVIIITAKPSMKGLFEAEGVADYITKPFETDELLEKIKKVLG